MIQVEFRYGIGSPEGNKHVNNALKELQEKGYKIIHVFILAGDVTIIYDDGVKIN